MNWKLTIGITIFTNQKMRMAISTFKMCSKLSGMRQLCFFTMQSLICLGQLGKYQQNVDGKPVEVEGLTPIEEAYNALRKAEGYVQHPGVDGNPFEYLRKMCPQFSDTLDFVIAFWKDFADTPVRWKYNYLKHKGSLCYKEIQEREPRKIFSLQVNDKKCPSDIRDVQATINLIDAIEELRRFDNEKLFPYIESLFIQLETLVKPSPLIF